MLKNHKTGREGIKRSLDTLCSQIESDAIIQVNSSEIDSQIQGIPVEILTMYFVKTYKLFVKFSWKDSYNSQKQGQR